MIHMFHFYMEASTLQIPVLQHPDEPQMSDLIKNH